MELTPFGYTLFPASHCDLSQMQLPYPASSTFNTLTSAPIVDRQVVLEEINQSTTDGAVAIGSRDMSYVNETDDIGIVSSTPCHTKSVDNGEYFMELPPSSTQYPSNLLFNAYSRVTGEITATSETSASPYNRISGIPLRHDATAIHAPLLPASAYDIKEAGYKWRTANQSDSCYPFASSIPNYQLANNYGSMELNNAARRKNSTRENTSTLKSWLYEHRKNPYPTKGEKIMLAIITKMTLTQVSTWFANARRRLKKENKMTWSPKSRIGDADGDHINVNDDVKEKASDSNPADFLTSNRNDHSERRLPISAQTTKSSGNINNNDCQAPGMSLQINQASSAGSIYIPSDTCDSLFSSSKPLFLSQSLLDFQNGSWTTQGSFNVPFSMLPRDNHYLHYHNQRQSPNTAHIGFNPFFGSSPTTPTTVRSLTKSSVDSGGFPSSLGEETFEGRSQSVCSNSNDSGLSDVNGNCVGEPSLSFDPIDDTRNQPVSTSSCIHPKIWSLAHVATTLDHSTLTRSFSLESTIIPKPNFNMKTDITLGNTFAHSFNVHGIDSVSLPAVHSTQRISNISEYPIPSFDFISSHHSAKHCNFLRYKYNFVPVSFGDTAYKNNQVFLEDHIPSLNISSSNLLPTIDDTAKNAFAE